MTEPKKSTIKWEPMPNKIVVQVVGERETYGSGIIFRPPTVAQPRTTGKVIAVYEPFVGIENDEYSAYLKVGDIVIFGRHGGIELEYGGEKVIVLNEKEILTKVVVENDEMAADIQHSPGTFDDLEG